MWFVAALEVGPARAPFVWSAAALGARPAWALRACLWLLTIVSTKYTGLKVGNGAEFTAVDVILNPNYLGYHLADDVTIYFGLPLGILLQSEGMKAFREAVPPGGDGTYPPYFTNT